MSEQHTCTICNGEDMPPDILPYCTGGDIKNPVHSWAHPQCVFAVMEAKRNEAGPGLHQVSRSSYAAVSRLAYCKQDGIQKATGTC